MSTDTHNANGNAQDTRTGERVTRRTLESAIDTALTNAKKDPKAYAELTIVLRTALKTKNPSAFMDTVGALVAMASELRADVADDAITNVRKDHGIVGKDAPK